MTSDNLRLGERALRDNVPIRFNELSEKSSSKTHADDLPKHMTVKVAIRTEYFGITGNAKAKSGDCSVGYKCFRKLDHIQDNLVRSSRHGNSSSQKSLLVNLNPIQS